MAATGDVNGNEEFVAIRDTPERKPGHQAPAPIGTPGCATQNCAASAVEHCMRIRWPFDNVYHSTPLSPDLLALALEKLRDAGIESAHQAERDELVDIMTGQPTGYVHCAEVFVVDDADGPRARQILAQVLDPRDRPDA